MEIRASLGALAFVPALVCCSLPAQTLLTLPEDSPRAVCAQRIGMTDVTIIYHRPFVKGRKIWGGIVPYGQAWRAGANETPRLNSAARCWSRGSRSRKGLTGCT